VHGQDPRTVPSDLLRKVWSHTSLERAWRVIEENARNSKSENVKKEVATFRAAASRNLRSLSARLSGGTFRFEAAKGVPIPKNRKLGKANRDDFRPIVVANIDSRIVQRSILDALLGVPSLAKIREHALQLRRDQEKIGE
jgi:retron-type reverse transcriptase